MTNAVQPKLFEWSQTSVSVLELYPAVWGAAEQITSPDLAERQDGLQRLVELNAARYSPLIACLVATRLSDPEISLRARVIGIIGAILRPDEVDNTAPEQVLLHLSYHLGQMQPWQILSLLQALSYEPSSKDACIAILKECSLAGEYLAEQVGDRRVPVEIRQLAIELIGDIGYLDAIPALERLQVKLEARLKGQQTLAFYLAEESEEAGLLPEIQLALTKLHAP